MVCINSESPLRGRKLSALCLILVSARFAEGARARTYTGTGVQYTVAETSGFVLEAQPLLKTNDVLLEAAVLAIIVRFEVYCRLRRRTSFSFLSDSLALTRTVSGKQRCGAWKDTSGAHKWCVRY